MKHKSRTNRTYVDGHHVSTRGFPTIGLTDYLKTTVDAWLRTHSVEARMNPLDMWEHAKDVGSPLHELAWIILDELKTRYDLSRWYNNALTRRKIPASDVKEDFLARYGIGDGNKFDADAAHNDQFTTPFIALHIFPRILSDRAGKKAFLTRIRWIFKGVQTAIEKRREEAPRELIQMWREEAASSLPVAAIHLQRFYDFRRAHAIAWYKAIRNESTPRHRRAAQETATAIEEKVRESMRVTKVEVKSEHFTGAFFDELAQVLDSGFDFSVAEDIYGVIRKKHGEAKKYQRMLAATNPKQDQYIELVAAWYEIGIDAMKASIARARKAIGIKGSVYIEDE